MIFFNSLFECKTLHNTKAPATAAAAVGAAAPDADCEMNAAVPPSLLDGINKDVLRLLYSMGKLEQGGDAGWRRKEVIILEWLFLQLPPVEDPQQRKGRRRQAGCAFRSHVSMCFAGNKCSWWISDNISLRTHEHNICHSQQITWQFSSHVFIELPYLWGIISELWIIR